MKVLINFGEHGLQTINDVVEISKDKSGNYKDLWDKEGELIRVPREAITDIYDDEFNGRG